MDDLNEIYLHVAAEDSLSLAFAQRLIEDREGRLRVYKCTIHGGKNRLEKEAKELARSATTHRPNLLITDLDNFSCPAALVEEWLGRVSAPEGLLFLVAVREVEAWVLADRVGFAGFFNIPSIKIPHDPECLGDPKAKLLSLIYRHSPSKLVKEMTSSQGRGKGAGYNPRLTEFVRSEWRPERASKTSPSLARARQRIQAFADKFAS